MRVSRLGKLRAGRLHAPNKRLKMIADKSAVREWLCMLLLLIESNDNPSPRTTLNYTTIPRFSHAPEGPYALQGKSDEVALELGGEHKRHVICCANPVRLQMHYPGPPHFL